MVDVEAREAAALPIYLAVRTLCASCMHPAQCSWGCSAAGRSDSRPHRAARPRGHRATESKYSFWSTYFLRQVDKKSCPGAYLLCCASPGRSRGGIFIFPRGVGGFKFGGSPPSWPWVIAKQRQVGPENTWNNHAHGPCLGPGMGLPWGHTTAHLQLQCRPEVLLLWLQSTMAAGQACQSSMPSWWVDEQDVNPSIHGS